MIYLCFLNSRIENVWVTHYAMFKVLSDPTAFLDDCN